VARRPPEREKVYLDRGRRTTQLMRDSLGCTPSTMNVALAEQELLRRLVVAGLDPDVLDPWEAWKIFKDYLRSPVEGVYDAAAMLCRRFPNNEGGEDFYLSFVRQFSRWEGKEDAPLRRVVVDFRFDAGAFNDQARAEVWTHDFPTLAEFASVVEGMPQFQAAINARPRATDIWSEEL
jgi:hypothetical protein